MAKKEKKEEKGQLPPFAAGDGGFLFDIRWEEGILNYETKWSPNIAVITAVADRFAVGFKYSYCEPGNCVFGEASYMDGILTDTALDFDDFDAYEFDEETNLYRFENQDYECSEEIQEILLERKKAIANLQNSNEG